MKDLFVAGSASRRFAAAQGLVVYRRLVGDSGWLWTAGRDWLLNYAADSRVAKDSLAALAQSADTGPLAELVLAKMRIELVSDLAASRGGRRVSLEAFRRDCQPLLDGDSWLSRLVLAVAEAARSLDEKEIRSLADAASASQRCGIRSLPCFPPTCSPQASDHPTPCHPPHQ